MMSGASLAIQLILISFAKEEDLLEFAKAIRASDTPDPELEYIVTSLNEWQAPQNRRKRKNASERTSDEGREGYSYQLFRWPAFVSLVMTIALTLMQLFVLGWLAWLG
jgi:hypothetical protein